MPELNSFDFATIRIVPRVDREEFVNVGVIVFCLEQKFLHSRIQVNEGKLRALCPELEIDMVREHLEAFPRICAGEESAGPIAKLSPRERFQWLVAPRSTVIQISPVHSGLCELPQSALDELFRQLVA